MRLKIAVITSDKREHDRNYANAAASFGTAPEALLEGFAMLPEVEVHVISCIRQPVKSLEKLAPNIFFHSVVVPKIGWMRTLYQGCIRAIRRKLLEIRPDIVHGQGTEMECGISAALSGFPNVITIHGNMKAIAEFYRSGIGNFHWLAARLETFSLQRTAGVFCNSAYTESLVSSRAKRTWRVPNPLRQVFFAPQPVRLQNRHPVFLNIGVLSAYKRQLEVLEMMDHLWRRGLRFEMNFIGATELDTEYGSAFKRKLNDAERAGYARHLGTCAAGELIAVMDRADALIHAPTEESFGLVVAEALSRNMKLFASRTGGIVDIATDVEGSDLVPANDLKSMENAIASWIQNGYQRPTSAANVMRERYHPLAIARRHMEIYREVLGKKNSN